MSFFWSNEIKIKPASEAKAEVQEFYKKRMGIQQQIIKGVTTVINGRIHTLAIQGGIRCVFRIDEIEQQCPNENKGFFTTNDYKEMLKDIAQKYGEAGYNFTGLVNDSLILSWGVEEQISE